MGKDLHPLPCFRFLSLALEGAARGICCGEIVGWVWTSRPISTGLSPGRPHIAFIHRQLTSYAQGFPRLIDTTNPESTGSGSGAEARVIGQSRSGATCVWQLRGPRCSRRPSDILGDAVDQRLEFGIGFHLLGDLVEAVDHGGVVAFPEGRAYVGK